METEEYRQMNLMDMLYRVQDELVPGEDLDGLDVVSRAELVRERLVEIPGRFAGQLTEEDCQSVAGVLLRLELLPCKDMLVSDVALVIDTCESSGIAAQLVNSIDPTSGDRVDPPLTDGVPRASTSTVNLNLSYMPQLTLQNQQLMAQTSVTLDRQRVGEILNELEQEIPRAPSAARSRIARALGVCRDLLRRTSTTVGDLLIAAKGVELASAAMPHARELIAELGRLLSQGLPIS